MKDLNIAKTITNKRREKGLTQDQVAAYIGVTKASVSKWETGQSYPDITFLPQLAAYFNISIDELMGYTPQMTKEDIKVLYHRLSKDFSNRQFDEVWFDCQEIIKKYYSCYPLIFQMAVLLCNHWMLSNDVMIQKQILNEVIVLCQRIQNESSDVWLSKDAVSLEAGCYLMSGKPQKVLDLLGETIRPLDNDDAGIAQAYFMLGNQQQAEKVLQIGIYQHLLTLVSLSNSLLQLQNEQFDEILHRIQIVAEVFNIDELHPNVIAVFYLTAAQVFSSNGQHENAFEQLDKYVDVCIKGFSPFTLHGDDYFTEIDSWFQEFDLGTGTVRSEAVIRESMIQGVVQNPAFEGLKDNIRFKNIVSKLTQKKEY
jgi:transcriptional regulator with XRE-family HTH domain